MRFISGMGAAIVALAMAAEVEARPSPEEVLQLDTRLALELMHDMTPHIPLVVGGRMATSLAADAHGAWTVLRSTAELLSLTRGDTRGLIHPG